MFERWIYKRIHNLISKLNIVSPYQYGFRKGLSTETAVLSVLDYLYNIVNNKEISINIFIHFRKAFDTLIHHILFRKLEEYGIRGLLLQLIRSYFSDRSQRVKILEGLSSSATLPIGLLRDQSLDSFFTVYYWFTRIYQKYYFYSLRWWWYFFPTWYITPWYYE